MKTYRIEESFTILIPSERREFDLDQFFPKIFFSCYILNLNSDPIGTPFGETISTPFEIWRELNETQRNRSISRELIWIDEYFRFFATKISQ